MRVTAHTQSRFEELYYQLAASMSDYAIAARIADTIGKTLMAVYMYLRQCFTGGSERYKLQLIAAMEVILEDTHV